MDKLNNYLLNNPLKSYNLIINDYIPKTEEEKILSSGIITSKYFKLVNWKIDLFSVLESYYGMCIQLQLDNKPLLDDNIIIKALQFNPDNANSEEEYVILTTLRHNYLSIQTNLTIKPHNKHKLIVDGSTKMLRNNVLYRTHYDNIKSTTDWFSNKRLTNLKSVVYRQNVYFFT